MRGARVVVGDGGLRWVALRPPADGRAVERCVECARRATFRRATFAVSVDDPDDRVGAPMCAEHLFRLRESRRAPTGVQPASPARLF